MSAKKPSFPAPGLRSACDAPAVLGSSPDRVSISTMLDVLAEEHHMLHETIEKLSEALLPVRYGHIPEGMGVHGDDGEPQMVQKIQAVTVSATVARARLNALLSSLAL